MNKIYIPVALRQAVIERAANRCEYCQSPALYSPEIFEIEHIHPISSGGKTELANLALACPACNRYKGSLQVVASSQAAEMIPLFNPRTDDWTTHFAWSDDLAKIVGLTSTGQVTITTLQMNRPSVQRFRIALYAVDLHPTQL